MTANGQPPARSRGPALNRVELLGRVASDPELKRTGNGTAIASFRIAVNAREEAEFFDVTAWEKLAEIVVEHLTKGRLVLVEGRLRTRSWTAQDGSTRRATEVVAGAVQFLSPSPQPARVN